MPRREQGDGRRVMSLEGEHPPTAVRVGTQTNRPIEIGSDEHPSVAQEEEGPGDHPAKQTRGLVRRTWQTRQICVAAPAAAAISFETASSRM